MTTARQAAEHLMGDKSWYAPDFYDTQLAKYQAIIDSATAELRAENERLSLELDRERAVVEHRDWENKEVTRERDEAREGMKEMFIAYDKQSIGSCGPAKQEKLWVSRWPWLKDSP